MTSSERAVTEIDGLLEKLCKLGSYTTIERRANEIISICRENRREFEGFVDFVISIVSQLETKGLGLGVPSWTSYGQGVDWLNRHYPSQGVLGAEAAMLDFNEGDTRALEQIEESLVDGFLAREREMFVSLALMQSIGLSWEKRVWLTKAAQKSYAKFLPQNLRNARPEQIAIHFEELVRALADSAP